MTITIKRGGASTAGWYATDKGAMTFVSREEYNQTADDLVIAFNLPTKGNERTTAVRVEFTPDEFELLTKTMFRADPIMAATAFGRALAQGFPARTSPSQPSSHAP